MFIDRKFMSIRRKNFFGDGLFHGAGVKMPYSLFSIGGKGSLINPEGKARRMSLER